MKRRARRMEINKIPSHQLVGASGKNGGKKHLPNRSCVCGGRGLESAEQKAHEKMGAVCVCFCF